MIIQIYHEKNEKFEIEFFKDEECTQLFDFETKNTKNLYIQLKDDDITPLLQLHFNNSEFINNFAMTKEEAISITNIFVSGISLNQLKLFKNFVYGVDKCNDRQHRSNYRYHFLLTTLESAKPDFVFITPNFSKHIPENNTILFLNQQDEEKYANCFTDHIFLLIL
jgi:hypothetical protein